MERPEEPDGALGGEALADAPTAAAEDAPDEAPVFTAGEDGAGMRLDAWLASASGRSRAAVQRLLAEGFVEDAATGAALGRDAAKRRVAPGDAFVLREPPPAPAEIVPQDIPLDVVFEEDALLVVDKPAGLVVHPAAGHPDGTLVNAVLHHCPDVLSVGGERRPGIVHRLDRDTSGLLAVAKTDAALAALADAWRTGAVRKEYLAILSGVPEPPAGHLESDIGRDPRDRKRMASVERGGKPASTDYEVAEDFGEACLARVRIHTGRTHQIRVHLSGIGCPVAGDPVYGSAAADRALPFRPARQMLHAWRLAFPHPATGAPLSFEAPPPSDFATLLAALRAR